MNNCDKFAELCSDYVEQSLSRADHQAMESHLADCPTCYEKVHGIKLLRNRLKQLPSLKTTPDFETVLRARIQISKNIGSPTFFKFPVQYRLPAFAVAVMVLIISASFLIQNQFPSASSLAGSAAAGASAAKVKSSAAVGNYIYSLDAIPMPQQDDPAALVSGSSAAQRAGENAAPAGSIPDSIKSKNRLEQRLKMQARQVSF